MRRILSKVIVLAALALSLTATTVLAAPETPTLSFSMGNSAGLGDIVEVKALLTNAAGAPISGATVAFTAPSTFFLGATGDVVLARVLTDKEGIAEAEFQARNIGQMTIRAEFAGNEKYAPAKTASQIRVANGETQLYVQEAGVRIPGINSAPFASSEETHGEVKSGLSALWPTMSFWPIGLVLTIVWSLYAFAVVQVVRIVKAAGRDDGLRSGMVVAARGGPKYGPRG